MNLFLIDAIGPFFRDYRKKRINWSKIPFTALTESEDQWRMIMVEMQHFCAEVAALGYNAVSLDDVAHLYAHPLHDPTLTHNIAFWRKKFDQLFSLISTAGLAIYLTVDAVPVTHEIASEFAGDADLIDRYFHEMIESVLSDFPSVAGIIMRIGESDGKDVKDPIRSELHIRSASQANQLIRSLLPIFEDKNRNLIFRTWTVGAHGIGDLIWHRDTLARTLDGIESEHFIVSMKHGESDFFRYLPFNESFSRVKQKKLLELQARREYEGAGEYPSLIARDCERYRASLANVENMVGISVWCQTGGWHRFQRRAFLEQAHKDCWIRWNVTFIIRLLKENISVDDCLTELCGADKREQAKEFLAISDQLVMQVLYIEDFAQQKRFFRRVRIPPLIHVYWDSVYIHSLMRVLLREWVTNHSAAVEQSSHALSLFPRLKELAGELNLAVDDIEHMCDLFTLAHHAREYYLTDDPSPWEIKIQSEKILYKNRWPKELRSRYRIKTNFANSGVSTKLLTPVLRLLLRDSRGYRIIDHLFVLMPLSVIYRFLRMRHPSIFPKALNKLAMGVDTLFY